MYSNLGEIFVLFERLFSWIFFVHKYKINMKNYTFAILPTCVIPLYCFSNIVLKCKLYNQYILVLFTRKPEYIGYIVKLPLHRNNTYCGWHIAVRNAENPRLISLILYTQNNLWYVLTSMAILYLDRCDHMSRHKTNSPLLYHKHAP